MRRLPTRTDDGAQADLLLAEPAEPVACVLWIPALGVTARHYVALAEALGEHSIAVALHEPRGGGSSSLRASRRCDWGYREILEVDLKVSLAAARAALPNVPWFVAGHSIGGQFAALFAALHPGHFAGIATVASGSPYWQTFKRPQRWLLRAALGAVPAITTMAGHYPGRRLGFAGNEAASLMRDWARSGRSGHYRPRGIDADLESAMRTATLPIFGLHLADDRLCPPASLDWLLGKFAAATIEKSSIDASAFASGAATHFSWMKDVDPVVERLAQWMQRTLERNRASVASSAIEDPSPSSSRGSSPA